jgi:hypothetical protein
MRSKIACGVGAPLAIATEQSGTFQAHLRRLTYDRNPTFEVFKDDLG